MNDLRYGFRYDPMQWVSNDCSFQSAVVRASVLKRPAED